MITYTTAKRGTRIDQLRYRFGKNGLTIIRVCELEVVAAGVRVTGTVCRLAAYGKKKA
ncbi:MAG: hypothetical protein KDB07_03015 [Planctomycetes bacterium]|nr:hypothetical protein [Planctomycetota bacterium]